MRSSCSVNYVGIVRTFEENGLFRLRVVFLFSQFSPIKTTIFDKIFLYPIDDINFLSSDEKSSPPIIFWIALGVFKLPISRSSGLYFARFEEFLHIADGVTRIIYAWQIIQHNKMFQNELRLVNQTGHNNFVRLKISR